ncbi:hypothetical protein AEA09_10500 [Lysinibacillus contaminans]|uniref:Uncharacterized protein n=1 Tax=Lysinibacillus contaminans TaxID=1293441 RepID=A0ABR5K2D7_9BACI|nr:hypothetical protein [Lysinibacillus contaminans]KOS68933.1 hypothetical protein AEA09_10500 [Lysinibacillus contaminans]
MTILVLFVCVIKVVIAIFIFKENKKVSLLLLSIPFLLILGIGAWLLFERNYHFVKDTDLSIEIIRNIELEKSLKEYIKENPNTHFTKGENVKYPNYVNGNDVSIGADKSNKIKFFRTISLLDETSKHIKVSDSKDTVINKYGESYYEGRDMGMGEFIAYVDRDSKRYIRFWLNEGKVREIEFMLI